MMKKIDTILKKIIETCDPVSVFLYGSRARTDFLKRSDFEIGILIPEDRYISRSEIRKKIKMDDMTIYPFRLKNFKKGIIDTPFQKAIYLRELISSGKILYGEKIFENMKPPSIAVLDIIQDLRFNIGYAFASMHSYRNGDKFTASYEFYKSCLFGTRSLLILKKRKFALSYDEIFLLSRKLDIDIYSDLVKTAYDCRAGKTKYGENDLFQNISYLNKFIEPEIMKYFKKYGNKILIK